MQTSSILISCSTCLLVIGVHWPLLKLRCVSPGLVSSKGIHFVWSETTLSAKQNTLIEKFWEICTESVFLTQAEMQMQNHYQFFAWVTRSQPLDMILLYSSTKPLLWNVLSLENEESCSWGKTLPLECSASQNLEESWTCTQEWKKLRQCISKGISSTAYQLAFIVLFVSWTSYWLRGGEKTPSCNWTDYKLLIYFSKIILKIFRGNKPRKTHRLGISV